MVYPISVIEGNNGRLSAILNSIELNIFRVHSPLKPHILFFSIYGVAIFSSFHDIPQNILIGYTYVINKA